MTKIAYVNGSFIRQSDAGININDRGVVFGDAIYEVWAVKNRKLLDEEGHFKRLKRSLNELRIAYDVNEVSMKLIIAELLKINRITDGMVYLQISRGTAPRDHKFPKNITPNIIMTAKRIDFNATNAKAHKGIAITFTRDNRWDRVDIKTTNLLGNVLAKQSAVENGFDDVWFYDEDGFITEGSSNNAWIVDKDNNVITRPLSNDILAGITRQTTLKAAHNAGFNVLEKKFTIEDVKNAKEAFLTSATQFIMPIVKVDQTLLGEGKVGEVASKLRSEYIKLNM